MEGLNHVEWATLRLLASGGMNVSRTSEILGCSRKTIYDRIRNIKNKTGKDPTDFWDLHELLTERREDEEV